MTTALDSSFFEFFKFWIWINHNSLLSIPTNQFAWFFIDLVRSRQCYFRVCQSGKIWNKRAFFPCILIFLLYKTKLIDSMLLCVCSVIDHKGRQNVLDVKTSKSAVPRFPLFCSYHILTSSVIYYWTDARQHRIFLLTVSLVPILELLVKKFENVTDSKMILKIQYFFLSLYVKLTDFGLSYVRGGVGSDSMMQSVCGTPIYMGGWYHVSEFLL